MNKVILIGNLTRDPELATTNSGVNYCRFSLAVQRRFSTSSGEREADFINVVVWRAQAENCYKYLKKGSRAGVVGSIQTRNYEGQDGQKRYVTEVVADEVEFLSTRAAEDGKDVPATDKKAAVEDFEPVVDDDDLPF